MVQQDERSDSDHCISEEGEYGLGLDLDPDKNTEGA
jgi:hypothetical protein